MLYVRTKNPEDKRKGQYEYAFVSHGASDTWPFYFDASGGKELPLPA